MLLFEKQPKRKKKNEVPIRSPRDFQVKYSNQTRVVLFLGKGMGQKPKQKLEKGGSKWARKQRKRNHEILVGLVNRDSLPVIVFLEQ